MVKSQQPHTTPFPSTETADVTVTLSTSMSLKDRRRRTASVSPADLPSTLTFTFTVGIEVIQLNLEKNMLIDMRPPVFVIRHGKIVSDRKTLQHQQQYDVAFYQDKKMEAALMVRRTSHGQRYQLTGSYFQGGQEFSIQPTRESDTGDVDHVIFRVIAQNNLQNDVITFETINENNISAAIDDSTDSLWTAYSFNHEYDSNNDRDDKFDVNLTDIDKFDVNLTDRDKFDVNFTDRDKFDVNFTDRDKFDVNLTDRDKFDVNFTNRDNNTTDCSNDTMSCRKRTTTEGIYRHHIGTDSLSLSHNTSILVSDLTLRQGPEITVSPADGGQDTQHYQTTRGVRKTGRKRRQTRHYVLELAMVIDYGVYQVWYDGVTDLQAEDKRRETINRIQQFYSYVLNGIDLRYNSVRRLADFHLDVTWAGIIIFDKPVKDYWANVEKSPRASRDRVESSLALETFRSWAINPETGLPPSDHLMLFTGHNLTYGGSVSNAGLAYLGSACNPDYFFSIVEEYFDFRDVAIAAHELGHSLGARHDMDGNVCLSQDRYIMTSRFQFPSQRKARNPWLFSQCSVQYFEYFIQELDRNGTNCLLVQESTNDQEIVPYLMSLPGEVYAGDDFCRIGGGDGSYICREQHLADYSNICYGGVYCYSHNEQGCVAKLPPDGFSCGNKKWCMNGTCQQSESAPETPDDSCPFGDSPDVSRGQTCSERVRTSRSDCYKETFIARCCASCLLQRRNLPGCEYGDQFELCQKELCLTYDLEYARDNCCDTCAELLYTLPVTTVTSQPNQASDRTISGSWAVTSISEDQTAGWRTHVTGSHRPENIRPEAEEEVEEEEERARIRQKTDRKINQKWLQRDSSDSSDSDDSDQVQSRDYRGHVNGNELAFTRDQIRAQRGQQSLGMIRNLLDDMRNSRDTNRLQRMRLLINILDRIRQDNLREMSKLLM